jgi:hypothetical protein
MAGHSTWKNWDGARLPEQLYQDLTDAVNGLLLSKQLPEGVFFRYQRERSSGKWVVVFWRPDGVPGKGGKILPVLNSWAHPIADILADGHAALKKLRYTFDHSGKTVTVIRGRVD